MELITGRPAINNNLPLRICYKNVIKLVCIYHFSKKKKMWNGFVAMALPKQEEKKIVAIGLWQWHCRNRGGKNCRNEFVAMALSKQEEKKKYCLILAMALPKQEIGGEREHYLNIYIYIYKGHIFLFFHSFLDLFCVYVMFLPFAMKSQSTYQPITSNSSSDSYSLLGFILRLNLPKSISDILFCLFISPLHNKRQVTSSQSYILAEELHLLTTPIVHLLICFASMCTTKDYKFFVNITFFALLINQKLTDLLLL